MYSVSNSESIMSKQTACQESLFALFEVWCSLCCGGFLCDSVGNIVPFFCCEHTPIFASSDWRNKGVGQLSAGGASSGLERRDSGSKWVRERTSSLQPTREDSSVVCTSPTTVFESTRLVEKERLWLCVRRITDRTSFPYCSYIDPVAVCFISNRALASSINYHILHSVGSSTPFRWQWSSGGWLTEASEAGPQSLGLTEIKFCVFI